MIHFNIIQSPDTEVIGEIQVNYNSLTFGNNSKAHIYIEDVKMSAIHLRIFAKKDKFFCSSEMAEAYFHINGKKIVGTKDIDKNDTIQIGDTKIKIIDLAVDPDFEIKKYDLKEIHKNAPEVMPVIEDIQNEILYIDSLEE